MFGIAAICCALASGPGDGLLMLPARERACAGHGAGSGLVVMGCLELNGGHRTSREQEKNKKLPGLDG